MVAEVEIIWNFWPFDLFVWFPFRLVLNGIFLIFWIPSTLIYPAWNAIPETLGIVLWALDIVAIPFTLIAWIFCGFYLFGTTYLIVSSVPDIYLALLLPFWAVLIVVILYSCTGFKWTFDTMPEWAVALQLAALFGIST